MYNACAVSSVAVAIQSSDDKLYTFAFSKNKVRNVLPNAYKKSIISSKIGYRAEMKVEI